MKHFFTLTFLLLAISFLNAQTTEDFYDFTNLNPQHMILDGTDLYISVYGNYEGKIVKFDMTQSNPTPVDVVTNVLKPIGIALQNNDLYIADYDSKTIMKADISTIPANASKYIDDASLQDPRGLLLVGNDLYISDYDGQQIFKVDTTTSTTTLPPPIATINNYKPYAFLNYNNEIYFSLKNTAYISRLDDSNPNGYVNVLQISNVADFALDGTDLYCSQSSPSKVTKTDFSTPPQPPAQAPPLTEVITGLNYPLGILIYNNYLYVAESNSQKVIKFNLQTLDTEDYLNEEKLSITPNPSTIFLKVSGLRDKVSYSIINCLGAKIQDGDISNNQKIDINNLAQGLYFLKLNNHQALKFIKE